MPVIKLTFLQVMHQGDPCPSNLDEFPARRQQYQTTPPPPPAAGREEEGGFPSTSFSSRLLGSTVTYAHTDNQ